MHGSAAEVVAEGEGSAAREEELKNVDLPAAAEGVDQGLVEGVGGIDGDAEVKVAGDRGDVERRAAEGEELGAVRRLLVGS